MHLLIDWCLMCVDTRVAECVEVRRHLAVALVGDQTWQQVFTS